MKVLLVGNSSIDESKKYGKLIDDFDLVVRFNRYSTSGFEEYIGTKTNIWVLNRAIPLKKSAVSYDIKSKFIENKNDNKELESMLMLTYVSSQDEVDDLIMKTDHFSNFQVGNTFEVSRYLRECWDRFMNTPFYKPATGIISVMYFLQRYDKVCLHNFDFGKTKHYWNDHSLVSEPTSSKHDWSFDEKIINALIDSKEVDFLEDNE